MTQAASDRARDPAPGQARKFTVPESGEALLTDVQMASVYEVSVATIWAWARTDSAFPKPIRRGERFTRWKASAVRAHLSGLAEGVAKDVRGERAAS